MAKKDAPTATITIKGMNFTIPAPYAEGHVCTAGEAHSLNQTLSENIRNNFSKRVEKAKEEAGGELTAEQHEELQVAVTDYAESYEFGVRRSGRGPSDPVEREARKIARATIEQKLKEQNIDKKSLPEGKMDEFIDQVLEKHPGIRDEAKRRVEATQAVAAEVLTDAVS